jgi:hypothetical protein
MRGRGEIENRQVVASREIGEGHAGKREANREAGRKMEMVEKRMRGGGGNSEEWGNGRGQEWVRGRTNSCTAGDSWQDLEY